MKSNPGLAKRIMMLITVMLSMTLLSSRLQADTGTCGGVTVTLPFTDVMASTFFCQIAEAYFAGLTNGTTATTYSPANIVTRDQMAAFVTRTMDQSLRRSSQYWPVQGANNLAVTTVQVSPQLVKSDGADLWVANSQAASVSRVRASDGKRLENWTGGSNPYGVLCAMGQVFVTGQTNPGKLYSIDPTLPAGTITTLSSALGPQPQGIAYDGEKIWTANSTSVSIITLNPTVVTNITTGFQNLNGIIYDGANIWVTDDKFAVVDTLHKLDSNGAILLTVDVGDTPQFPAFDGTNIWVPNFDSNTVTVVRATGGLAGTVLATLSGNGLFGPTQAAFDGERILVGNFNGNSVSLWKASDLTPIGTFSTGVGTNPSGVCSDGPNFWITLKSTNQLARF